MSARWLRPLVLALFASALLLPKGDAAPVKIVEAQVLSTRGSTRGTAYAGSNKVVTVGSRTHCAWLDYLSATMVRTYDHEKHQWLPAVKVGDGTDNHGGPALAVDSKGYLHIVFGPHHGPFQYCVSQRPNDASSWVPQGEVGDRATYPGLVCDAHDTLHLAYRGGDAPWKLMYQRKPAGGDWTEPRILVEPGVPDGYTQYGNALCLARDGTLHLAYHIYDLHPARGKTAGHMMSRDGGETWLLADGTPLEMPVTPQSPGFVEQDPKLDLRVGNVACDRDGHPYFVACHYEQKPSTGILWRHDGSAWRATDLGEIVRADHPGGFLREGSISFDLRDRLYVAVTVSQRGGWGDPTNQVLLLTSDDHGGTFSILPVSEPDSNVSNWLVSLEHWTPHTNLGMPWLLYTHGEPGKTCTDEIYTEVRAVRFE